MTIHDLPLGKRYPDMTERFARLEQRHERQHLESSLATAFCAMQRSFDAAERQKQWFRCLELASELDRLGDNKAE